MANELSLEFNDSFNTYALLRLVADNTIWDVGDDALEAIGTWNDARLDECDIVLTARNGDLYTADMPASAPVGMYKALYYLRAGGSPAITDGQLSSESFYWDGTNKYIQNPSDYKATVGQPSME